MGKKAASLARTNLNCLREPAIGLFIYRGVENTFKRLIEYAIAKPAPALAKCQRQRSYSNSPVQGPARTPPGRSTLPAFIYQVIVYLSTLIRTCRLNPTARWRRLSCEKKTSRQNTLATTCHVLVTRRSRVRVEA